MENRDAGVSVIEVRSVWKIFGSRVNEALEAIGLGEIFRIMGLSKSRKSTLVRHINRLIEPTTGEIFPGSEFRFLMLIGSA